MKFTFLLSVLLILLGVVSGTENEDVVSNGSTIFTMSEEEEHALSQFRELAADLTYREFMKSDGYLLRWLAEFDFEVETTLEKFTRFIEWRREKNVDSIVFEDFSILEEELPVVLNGGFDKFGRPVIWIPVGAFNFRKTTISGTQEIFQRYVIRIYELMEMYLHMRAPVYHNVTQLIGIYDLTGYNLKTGGCLLCLRLIPPLVTNFDNNYPGLFYKGFLIHTPKIFLTPLNMGRSFMSERTRQALLVFGYDKDEWTTALSEQIDRNELPIEYGGTKPSFHGKGAKDAALNFTMYLVSKARESVEKDLKVHSESDLSSTTAELPELPNEDLKPQSTPKKHHHHHYSVPESVQARLNHSNTGALISNCTFYFMMYVLVFMRMLTC